MRHRRDQVWTPDVGGLDRPEHIDPAVPVEGHNGVAADLHLGSEPGELAGPGSLGACLLGREVLRIEGRDLLLALRRDVPDP